MGVAAQYIIYLFSDFVQSTRYIKQKDTSPLQGFSTWIKRIKINAVSLNATST